MGAYPRRHVMGVGGVEGSDERARIPCHRLPQRHVVKVDDLRVGLGRERLSNVDLPTDRGPCKRMTGSSAMRPATIGASRLGTRPHSGELMAGPERYRIPGGRWGIDLEGACRIWRTSETPCVG